MAFTEEQQAAIDFRNGNLLVSAAAGSGKTAVLVERIIGRISNPDEHVELDNLVIVTFTKAAAGEMKERLSKALEDKLVAAQKEVKAGSSKKDFVSYLAKQLSKVESAKICTIDSFFNFIVKDYYNVIEIDPSYRVCDDAELGLMKKDVYEALMDDKFNSEDADFAALVDAYADGKTTNGLFEITDKLYRFSQSKARPAEWLADCGAAFMVKSSEELMELPQMKTVTEYVRTSIRSLIEELEDMISEIENEPGFENVVKGYSLDLDMLKKYAEAPYACETLSFANMRSYGPKGAYDKELKVAISDRRDRLKKRSGNIVKYYPDPDITFDLMQKTAPYVKSLVDFVVDFSKALAERKSEKNLVEFADVEHYALDILIEGYDENGHPIYSEVADELAHKYEEIYIDEYQDSNEVQETILAAVSKERFGTPDIFMVGDVKQSIYKFREAKPEIFMEKYNTYAGSGPKTKIELHKNFRSSQNVLDCINDICRAVMKADVGGVEYTDDVQLNFGRLGEPLITDDVTDIILAAPGADEGNADRDECNAHLIAQKIKSLMEEQPTLHYKDMVILLRGCGAHAEKISKVLEEYGIPNVYEKKNGYFAANEITTVLDFLKVLDNPRQEIPLAGLMRSYFAYFDVNELALIKGRTRKTELYDCVCRKALDKDELGRKCLSLLCLMEDYRDMAKVSTIHELISSIIYSTGYYDYVAATDRNKTRRANLDMLVQKAKEYENTSYTGLFNFVRYIDQIKSIKTDFAEAQTESELNDVVRIMTIHSSKGLEFPVVFLGNTNVEYNTMDLRKPVLCDDEYGIAMNYVDLDERIKYKNPYKDIVGLKLKRDQIGEELRVLYVALTRAKDKLIITGYVDKLDEKMKNWNGMAINGDLDNMYMPTVLGISNYMGLIMTAYYNQGNKGRFSLTVKTLEDIRNNAANVKLKTAVTMRNLMENAASLNPDEEVYGRVKNIFEFRYPHTDSFAVHTKYSVSDIKHKKAEEDDEIAHPLHKPELEKRIPGFVKTQTEPGGAAVGTAYHKVFELMDYSISSDKASFDSQLADWVEKGLMTKEDASCIRTERFVHFLTTDIGMLMREAALKRQLFREQEFYLEVPASRVDDAFSEEENILVQGIIDAFFFKDDKIWVVDYKTDVCTEDNCDVELNKKYAAQLRLYCEALKKVTGREIGGCYMYSTRVGRKIEVKL